MLPWYAVVAFQEMSMEPEIHYLNAGSRSDPWLIVAAKRDGEWRARAIAVRKEYGVVAHGQVGENGMSVCVTGPGRRVGILNVHLPSGSHNRDRESARPVEQHGGGERTQIGGFGRLQ